MATGISITTKSDLRTLKALSGGGIERALREALSDMAEQGRKRAVQAAPKRTGRLARSIRVEKQGSLIVGLTAAAPYAVHVEYGTRHMRARPFLTPAAEWVRTQLPGAIREKVGQIA